ncbi:hypothetical protein [Nocardioides limicola]|uniref:hypothetical protein n=1 Tax=Nocardioides limicola TaxID=2803368 RepID=UPI00193B4944|nr:hypothetical protein [Nocardioides sp. DJM-14]
MTHQDAEERVAELERENAHLRQRMDRLEREATSMRPVVQQVKNLQIWDFTPYGVHPDGSWVAVDRACAAELLAALAGVDHWEPWATRIEPRIQK